MVLWNITEIDFHQSKRINSLNLLVYLEVFLFYKTALIVLFVVHDYKKVHRKQEKKNFLINNMNNFLKLWSPGIKLELASTSEFSLLPTTNMLMKVLITVCLIYKFNNSLI